jgi:hypothetical protein
VGEITSLRQADKVTVVFSLWRVGRVNFFKIFVEACFQLHGKELDKIVLAW